jgi:hypothetical protein
MSHERRFQPAPGEGRRNNEDIVNVRLPKEGRADLILPTWDHVVTTLRHFQTEEFQRLPIPSSEAFAEKKLRDKGKIGALSEYSGYQIDFFTSYYNAFPTNENNVSNLLSQAKPQLEEGKKFISVSSLNGRALHESRLEIENLYQINKDPIYKLTIGSEILGNFLEDKLESKGVERASRAKFVVIEYAHKEGNFIVDFDDVSKRLRTVLGNDNPQLSGDTLAHRLDSQVHDSEKVTDLGDYEGFHLQMYARHDGGFNRLEGNKLLGLNPRPLQGGWIAPSLEISIATSGIQKKGDKGYMQDYVIIIPEQRQASENLAERIAGAFKNKN